MKRSIVIFLLAMTLAAFTLASCKTVEIVPEPEPVAIEEPAKPEAGPRIEPVTPAAPPAPETVPEPVGPEAPKPDPSKERKGPHGGALFAMDGYSIEIGQPLSNTTYSQAIAYCAEMTANSGVEYRLPSIKELTSIYYQNFALEIPAVDMTFYWSSDTLDENSAQVLNFSTGFEGSYYRTLSIVCALPVTTVTTPVN